MALVGPRITGDADIRGIVKAIRSEGRLVEKSANFTIGTREAEIFRATTGTLTATAPPANDTDLENGATFMLINNGAGTMTVLQNTSGTVGTIPAGNTSLLVLLTSADANGTWQLINLDASASSITKVSETFNADISPTAGASWTEAANGAHSITFALTGITANPLPTIFDSTGEVVIIKTVVSGTTSAVISVPDITGATFAGVAVFI